MNATAPVLIPRSRRFRSRELLLLCAGLLLVVAPMPGFVALLLGAGVAMAVGTPAAAQKVGNKLLKFSIVGLGAGMNLQLVLSAGLDGLGATALTLTLAIVAGLLIGRRLGVARDVGLLVTVGTAICGGSAIAATAPVLRARAVEVAAALGVVFLLNAIALVLFPLLGTWLGMEPAAFGRWCAMAIHDTSSVVGASAAFGDEALEIATVTKLARALWIVPVSFAVALLPNPGDAEQKAGRPSFPWFIVAFIAAAALVTWLPALEPAGQLAAGLGRRGMVLALFCIGLGMSPAAMRGLGAKPLLLGVLLWLLLGSASLWLV